MKNGSTISCGCYMKETKTTHDMSYSKEYMTWRSMLKRCYNKQTNGSEFYYEKNILVCDRWRYSFENFYADMGDCPGPDYSLERKNTNGNYEPGNCKWATWYEQSINKNIFRNNKSGQTGISIRKSGQFRVSIYRYNERLIDKAIDNEEKANIINKIVRKMADELKNYNGVKEFAKNNLNILTIEEIIELAKKYQVQF